MESRKAEAVRLLFELKKCIRPNMKGFNPDMGITMSQGMVIGLLSHSGEMKMTELSSKLGLSNSTVSGIVDRLEKQTIVERIRSIEDKRIVTVRLHPGYCNMHEELHKNIGRYFEKIFDNASDEDLVKIIDGLAALLKVISINNEVGQ